VSKTVEEQFQRVVKADETATRDRLDVQDRQQLAELKAEQVRMEGRNVRSRRDEIHAHAWEEFMSQREKTDQKLAYSDVRLRKDMLEKRTHLQRLLQVQKTQDRFREVDLKREEQERAVEMARRSSLDAEEAKLVECYERALNLAPNANEAELRELAEQVGINYDVVKGSVKKKTTH
jgi:hypothetical protein